MKKKVIKTHVRKEDIKLRYPRVYLSNKALFVVMENIVKNMKIDEQDASSIPSKHPLRVYTITDTKGLWWVAEYTNLPGVVGTARDRQKAIEDLKINSEFHIKSSIEAGFKIPDEYLRGE